MAMVAGIGGRPVMNATVTDKRTGQQTTVQGTNMNDILRGAAGASQRWGNNNGQTGSWGGVSNVSKPMNFGGGMQGGYVPGIGTVGAVGAGGASGASNALFNARTANNGFSQGYGNNTPLGQQALRDRQASAQPNYGAAGAGGVGSASGQAQVRQMTGGGMPLPGGVQTGAVGGAVAGNVQGLLNQQMQQNDKARNQNEQNWQQSRDYLLNLPGKFQNDKLNQGVRNQAQGLIDNPEALNDRTQNAILNRQSNAIQAQGDNQLKQAQGLMQASGRADLGSALAAQERIGRSTMAAQQNAQTDLEIQRANQRNADIQNAIKTGQGVTGQQYALEQGVGNTILENLPQYMPDDLSGWLAAVQQPSGGGGAGMGMDFMSAMGGGGGGGYDAVQAEFGGSGGWDMPMGYTRPKGPSTYAGFNVTDRQSAYLGDGRYGTIERPLGVDPIGTGGFGFLGSAEGLWDFSNMPARGGGKPRSGVGRQGENWTPEMLQRLFGG